ALAAKVAAQSITLVRNDGDPRLLPLKLSPEQRIVVVLPRLSDLTPADTSSLVEHTLADHIRRYHGRTVAMDVPADPSASEVAAIVARLGDDDVVLVGTLNARAQPGQAALAKAVLGTGRPTVVAALRLPYDLLAFPEAP